MWFMQGVRRQVNETIQVFRSEHLNESIFLKNVGGLKVFVMPKPGFRRKYAEMFVHYGSNDNVFMTERGERKQVPAGIAHFLEHKMFEKPYGDAFSAFAGLGASANAYTGNNYTSYLFWTLNNLPQALEVLFDVVFNPYFTPESIDKEKGIIAQEIRMYNDQPGARLMRETLSSLYVMHPVRIDVAGTEDSIASITPELLYSCHRAFYVPSNMSLFVAGDIEPGEVFGVISEIMAKLSPLDGKPPVKERPGEPMTVLGDRTVYMDVPTPLVQIAWKVRPAGDVVKQEIVAGMLLDIMFGKSSDFFSRVYDQGLVDDIRYGFEAWPDYAFGLIGAESPDPEYFADLVWEEISRFYESGVPAGDFERVRKASLGRFVTLFDSFDLIGETEVHLYEMGKSVFDYGRLIEEVALENLNQAIMDISKSLSVRTVVKRRT